MRIRNVVVLLVVLATFARDARAVTITWSPVSSPGNKPDTVHMNDGTTGYGAVDYDYNIGTYDVTNSQYTEFLNDKDPLGVNALGLYSVGMNSGSNGGIRYNPNAPDGDKFTVADGDGNHPVNWVTWFQAIRFANWMNNGQGNADTETGAYTLLGGTPTPSNADSITRNPDAKIFLPSENEWYKAAYYNPATQSYYQFPTSSNFPAIATLPTSLPGHANFYPGGANGLTDVGAYSGTTSPFGAYDMGGDIYQWTDTNVDGFFRAIRGGSYFDIGTDMESSARQELFPYQLYMFDGFRLASVPEPSSVALAGLAAVGFGIAVIQRRHRFDRRCRSH